jgi:hypothetical protein
MAQSRASDEIPYEGTQGPTMIGLDGSWPPGHSCAPSCCYYAGCLAGDLLRRREHGFQG